MTRKLLIIGLDCLEPTLVFDKWRGELPNLSNFLKDSFYARMRSCDPPITVPAWSCMFSGKTPGELGVYGFRNRNSYSYAHKSVADSSWIKHERLWETASLNGRRSVVLGVPQTYPVKPLNGSIVAGILAPSDERAVYPATLKGLKSKVSPDYTYDISGFRRLPHKKLLREIYRMTDARFRLARHLLQKDWDLFVLVEIGPDRIQHAFWQYMDKESPYFEESPFKEAIKKYYIYLDEEVGRLTQLAGEECDIAFVSDHGAQTMKGLFRINQWLIQQGWLVLKKNVPKDAAFEQRVDWSRSKAWADGGYYARIYLNIAGREKQGIVRAEDAPAVLQTIRRQLQQLDIKYEAFMPHERYPEVQGIAPDMLVYFEDLAVRASASLGEGLFTLENDTGPDGANHSFHGLFAYRGQGIKSGRQKDISIYDCYPTWLSRTGLKASSPLAGEVLF